MKKGSRSIALFLALVSLLLVPGCASKKDSSSAPQGLAYFTYFDTVSYVYSYAGDSAELFNEHSADVSALLKKYHQLFDIYNEYSGINNLCTLNKNAGGDFIEVDPELIDFLKYTKEMYALTDGNMNVMFGAVLSIWHNCRAAAEEDPSQATVPSQEELESANEHCDISLLEIDAANSAVRISDPLASIDVGAIGKGYATEKAAQLLEAEGVTGYVLNIGGNVRMIGHKPDADGWVTGITDPNNSGDGGFSLRLVLNDTSCVTSGYYERFYRVKGVRYHHIIDKDTLFPAEGFASVSIVTKDSGVADALSTALFCVSKEEGMKILENFPGTEVIWIYPDGAIEKTPGLENSIL